MTHDYSVRVLQDRRPSAGQLLELALVTKHEAQQQATMRHWLLQLGEPSGKPLGSEEPPVFMHWNSNPLLPPPTPQAANCALSSPPWPCSESAPSGEESDLCRVPLQFLSQSKLETFDAEIEGVKKKAKSAHDTAS